MKLLLDLNLDELKKELSQYNRPDFVATQVYKWLIKGIDFEDMSNIPKDFRAELKANYIAKGAEILKKLTSKDGTSKYLLGLFDGNIIECVLMKYKHGNTICVSTQVGCRMGCTFCASTQGGLVRNLTAGEILAQVIEVNKESGTDARNITNIVLMGSGEPLDNYDNVVKFLKLVSAKEGLNISLRNISLSTSGMADKMRALADEGLPINLTISLHASNQSTREKIMPIAKKYSLEEVLSAARYYFEKTGRRVYIEYTLIEKENDTVADSEALAKLIKGMAAHVNIIRLNPVKGSKHHPSTDAAAYKFAEKLNALGVSATVRRQMGVDIEGACGQLRRKYIEKF